MTIAPFKLLSATTSAAAPFCLGHAFVQGEVPSGSQLSAGSVQLQCVAKNAWPDGSLKFAVLAGIASITGGVDLSVALSIGTPSGGSDLTTADLKATGVTASIVSSVAGTASWATTDWDSPLNGEAWVSGPKMSSWVYRKAIGSDAHLVGWLEVRLWAGGAVEILPWIENGYIRVASPANKSATYTFTMGGTLRATAAIDLKHHQRTPIINGAELSYWLGTDPGVMALSDSAYLQASELVPTYSAVVASGAARVLAQVATYVPLQQGNYDYDSDSMASSGYQRPIGLLPEHDVLHLVAASSDRVATYKSVVRNGFSAGRYCLHYRDETTQRPLKFSDYPNLVISDNQGFKDNGGSTTSDRTPITTGGNGPQWDVAHSPALGYMAYLLTGRWYFMEQVQFVTTANYLGNGDNAALREGVKGIVKTATDAWQTRSCAWDWRARVMALSATPDADTALRNEFITSAQHNIDHFHGRYVAQANNPFGWIAPGETYSGKTGIGSPWQQDFVTAAFGLSVSLDLPISSAHITKLAAFFQWKAKSAVMRLGQASGFWYINADVYQQAISAADVPDYVGGTGPWLATDADSYTATMVLPEVSFWKGSTEGTLYGEIMPGARAMWGNLLPAIAYAVRHGAPGASAAYARLTGATNYGALATELNTHPVWSVAPASIGASVVTTPGPKMRVGQLFAGKMAVSGFRGTGITAAQNGTGGTEPSLLAQHMVGADPTSEFLWVADDVPAGLDLTIYEDSSAVASGADGVYNGNKTVYTDGAGSAGTYSFTLGTPTSEITGVSITPTTATGSTDFDATVSGTGSFSTAKTFSKISGGGSIDASTGVFTPPAQTGSIQTIVVRATSTQDPTWHAEAIITIAALVVSRAPRFARPESDVLAGAWVPSSGSSLFAMLDEATADSADYISTTSASTAVVSLAPVVDPQTSVNQVVRYQAWAPTGGTLTVRLKQGSTVIASWSHSPLPTSPTIFAQSLTGPECDSITDYTLLQLEFVAAP